MKLSPDGRRRLLGIFGVVAVLALWEAAARLDLINSLLLSSPTGIVSAGAEQVTSGEFWGHLWVSFLGFVLGVGFSAVIGIVAGLAAGWSRRANYVIDPWLTILYSTPSVALAPLLIIAFDIGLTATTVIIFLFAVFPIAVNTMVGVHITAGRYLRVARSFSASDWMVLRTVVVPGALPYIVTGLRVAGPRALVGLVVAELLAGNTGIGVLLNLAGSTLNTGLLMFMVFILGMSGVLYAELLKRLEDRMERWRPAPGGG